ncbi:hypothetical protein [uncultured Maribacter sp.]|uniref:hypothetical protein n=1 Tax=uncultured Maribacter sp. TaxID=431308 RepID=UPI00262A6887|nr:hypothetical protein [uncultured Maribacter sp.]
MSIFRKIDKVLGAFGNIKALERTHVDTFTENLITNISGVKIAESKDGQLFAEFQELAGFDFLESTILSRENIKTFKGAKLSFIGANNELILDSDITEIESDYSNVSNRWMTKVSYVVTKDDIKFITEKKANFILFEHKKKSIKLYVIK